MADAVRFTHVDDAGVRRTVGLADAGLVDFAAAAAVRSFPSYKGQRNFPGFYFAACLGRLVCFESWLERDEAMAMDFDPLIMAFAPQPFRLEWVDHTGDCSHSPDYFARRGDGSGVVVDCRPQDRIKQRDRELFDGTAVICAEMGWEFRLVHGHDPVWLANVRWLAGYRLARFRREPTATALLDAFASTAPLAWAAAEIGDPIAVLPVLYHLLWSGELRAEMAQRLDGLSVVSTA